MTGKRIRRMFLFVLVLFLSGAAFGQELVLDERPAG